MVYLYIIKNLVLDRFYVTKYQMLTRQRYQQRGAADNATQQANHLPLG